MLKITAIKKDKSIGISLTKAEINATASNNIIIELHHNNHIIFLDKATIHRSKTSEPIINGLNVLQKDAVVTLPLLKRH